MKKILCILLALVVVLSGCAKAPETEKTVETPTGEESLLPENSAIGSLTVSVIGTSEALYTEFEDNGTKIKLENNDGKYFLVNYTLENKEEFEIDIDHSLEVILVDTEGKEHLGEYYEYPTGKENAVIKPGETGNIMLVSDLELGDKIKTVILKYKENQIEFSI